MPAGECAHYGETRGHPTQGHNALIYRNNVDSIAVDDGDGDDGYDADDDNDDDDDD